MILSSLLFSVGIVAVEEYREFVKPAEAAVVEKVKVPTKQQTALIQVVNWTEAGIEREIRAAFPEASELALAIAKCESGLDPTVQSQHILSYGREQSYGLFQIHAPDWDNDAKRLHLDDYRTDVIENIKMARYIYEQAGKRFTPWSCYALI